MIKDGDQNAYRPQTY